MSIDIVTKYLNLYKLEVDNWLREQEGWFEPRFMFFKSFFDVEKIESYDWEDFQELGNNIHSFQSLAIAKNNALGNPNLPIEKYREIFRYIIESEDDINIKINNLFKRYKGKYYLPSSVSYTHLTLPTTPYV